MPWRVRLVFGFVACIAVVSVAAVLDRAHVKRVNVAVQEARRQEARARDAAGAAALRLSDFQRRAEGRFVNPLVQAELHRLAGDLNRANAAANSAVSRIRALDRPWPCRRAWNRAAMAALGCGILWAVPAVWRDWRGARRRRAGLCAVCGYDLRASPGRCPECGAAPTVPA